jgi:SAM-dependent methyltransferase
VQLESRNFEILEEILVRAYARGYSVVEVPLAYFPRGDGHSHARVLRFGWDIVRSMFALWKLRNSINSADYDERAFYSVIPPQRYWQRRRHSVIVGWARGFECVLDAGCGSSIIIQTLNNAVGMDFSFPKLRFLRRRHVPVIEGSAFALPFKDRSFDCVISSQVIEHIRYDSIIFSEMNRVLREGGTLIIGTPDYATIAWRIIEPLYGFLMPGGYREEHITHYRRAGLQRILNDNGFVVTDVAYVGGAEMIFKCRKEADVVSGVADKRRLQSHAAPNSRLSYADSGARSQFGG